MIRRWMAAVNGDGAVDLHISRTPSQGGLLQTLPAGARSLRRMDRRPRFGLSPYQT